MKQTEKEIIQYLRQGKRLNISDIARKLSIPISTLRDRIIRIENSYITKRASIIDFEKTGHNASAIVAIKTKDAREELLEFLKQDQMVNSIWRINTGYDYMAEIICKDNMELYSWIDRLNVRFNTEFNIFNILKTEDKEKFIPR
ncbi:MAG: Lrp/AsnC family transcriptional regulator [Nanoarchaeota archaeon]|nr:Lrp/AsnC family transcriptional regulator [Nanoarchaeota archaeon]